MLPSFGKAFNPPGKKDNKEKQMNQIQKEYSEAKAFYLFCEVESDMAEEEFIKANQIKNKDGLLVKRIYSIEDEKEFDRFNEKFYSENAHIADTTCQAREELREKEKALVDYAMSIIPAKLADQLRSCLYIMAHRQKIIDIIMELDTRTVPACLG
jgi:hypothetical protein